MSEQGDNHDVSTADPPQAPDVRTELPGPRSRELLARGQALFYKGLGDELAPLVLDRKSGHTVTDVDGNVFLDLASASASVPLGAGREDLIGPAVDAIRRFGNEDSHALASPGMFELARRLVDLAPGSIDRVDIALNGTEAVETAVRMMRRVTGRPLVLAFHGGYHGESTATATLGAEIHEISAGDRALGTGFVHVPFPNPYRTPFAPPRPGGSGDCDGRLHPRRAAVSPRRPRPRRRRRDRAGPRLRRLHRSARRLLAGADRRSAPSTTGCSAPTRSRPAWGGAGRCWPSSAGVSSPT